MSSREQSTTAGPCWTDELARRLEEQRLRLQAAAATQRERARELETTLESRLQIVQDAVAAQLASANEREAEATLRLQQLHVNEARLVDNDARLAEHRGDLEAVRQSIAAAQQIHVERQQQLQSELAEQLSQIHLREAALAKEFATISAERAAAETLRRACDDAERIANDREQTVKLRQAELLRQSDALQRREESIQERENALRDREDTLRQRDDALRQREDALRARRDELQKAERQVHQLEANAATQAEHVKLHEQRLRRQRIAIAHELRARRKEMLAEAQQQRLEAAQVAAGDEASVALQLATANLELSKLRVAEESQLQHIILLEDQLEHAKLELMQSHELLEAATACPGETSFTIDSGELDDMQRRLEIALTDVRDLKIRNADLSEQVAKSRAIGSAATATGGGSMDWEARKLALLAQLESDFDEADPQQKANKLTVEAAIARTEELLSAKNEEILELQRLLSEQSGNIGGLAVGAAAIAGMFDADELIQQERENLRDIQEKLREQLRAAEIDLSVERAKMARERSLLEEKMRQFETQKSQSTAAQIPTADKGKKGSSNRGRWLQRLGLKDDEQR